MFVGDAPDGTRIIAGVTGDKDPGYGSTSKMIAESALCLAQDISREDTPGGVYTDRLVANAGLTFKIES